MAQVTFPPELGGDGKTYSDDSNPTTGMGNGGHRLRFVPALGQAIAMAATSKDKAEEANTSAHNASTSETNAGQSATAAAESASAANTSAQNASTSETNAGQSATAAAESASTSLTQANRAETEADRAQQAALESDIYWHSEITGHGTGFLTETTSVLSADDSTRTLTISPAVGLPDYLTFDHNRSIPIVGPRSHQVGDADGVSYLIFPRASEGGLAEDQLFDAGPQPGYNQRLVFLYGYDSENAHFWYVGDERHGTDRTDENHAWRHETFGLQWTSGGAVGYTLNDPADINLTLAGPVVLRDEDIRRAVNHSDTPTDPYQQSLNPLKTTAVYRKLNGNATSTSAVSESIWNLGTSAVTYNPEAGGIADVPDGKFVNYAILFTMDFRAGKSIKSVMGRQVHDTLDAARGEAFIQGDLPHQEMRFAYIVTAKVNYAITENPYKLEVVEVRNAENPVGSVPVPAAASHDQLIHRDWASQHPVGAIYDPARGNAALPDTFSSEAVAESRVVRDASGTFKVGAPTDPAHPALSGAVRTINPSVVGAPDYYGTLVVNLDMATGSFDLPEETPVGGRVLVRKLNATQGTVDINAPSGETITRASLSSVALNADGDYWLLEKVSPTRWELLDGWNTGQNANGRWKRKPDGTQVCHGTIAIPNTSASQAGFFTTNTDVLWTYPVGFVTFFEATGQISGFTSAWIGSGTASSNTITAAVRCNSGINTAATINGRLQATGRWYA